MSLLLWWFYHPYIRVCLKLAVMMCYLEGLFNYSSIKHQHLATQYPATTSPIFQQLLAVWTDIATEGYVMINQAGIDALTFFLQALTTVHSHRQMARDGHYAQLLGPHITEYEQQLIEDAARDAERELRSSLSSTLRLLRPELVGTPFEHGFDACRSKFFHPSPICDEAYTQLAVLLGQLASWSERPTERQNDRPAERQNDRPTER